MSNLSIRQAVSRFFLKAALYYPGSGLQIITGNMLKFHPPETFDTLNVDELYPLFFGNQAIFNWNLQNGDFFVTH